MEQNDDGTFRVVARVPEQRSPGGAADAEWEGRAGDSQSAA
ncbi:hypothetical protein ABZY14_29915 [Streptomyces sp. NPDC006617]